MLESLVSGAKGKSKIWAIRLWELETINALGWAEKQWIRLSLDERYRKVVSHKVSDWIQVLEAEDSIRRAKAKSGNK